MLLQPAAVLQRLLNTCKRPSAHAAHGRSRPNGTGVAVLLEQAGVAGRAGGQQPEALPRNFDLLILLTQGGSGTGFRHATNGEKYKVVENGELSLLGYFIRSTE